MLVDVADQAVAQVLAPVLIERSQLTLSLSAQSLGSEEVHLQRLALRGKQLAAHLQQGDLSVRLAC